MKNSTELVLGTMWNHHRTLWTLLGGIWLYLKQKIWSLKKNFESSIGVGQIEITMSILCKGDILEK